MDPGSTQSLCLSCYDVITTGNIERYYANHQDSTWIGQIISWNHNLRQEVKELKDDRDNAYFCEDGTVMTTNDLRTFYYENKDLRAVSHKQCSELVTSQFVVKDLKQENEALKKGHELKDQYIDSLRKEIEALKA
jgi:hypothetical protein